MTTQFEVEQVQLGGGQPRWIASAGAEALLELGEERLGLSSRRDGSLYPTRVAAHCAIERYLDVQGPGSYRAMATEPTRALVDRLREIRRSPWQFGAEIGRLCVVLSEREDAATVLAAQGVDPLPEAR